MDWLSWGIAEKTEQVWLYWDMYRETGYQGIEDTCTGVLDKEKLTVIV